MIVAIILCDRTASADAEPAYFRPLGGGSVVERTAQTVLRGPFGGTVVAAAQPLAAELKRVLDGYALQHVAAPAGAGPHAALAAGLAFAEAFRARWEKAMAAAAARFSGGGGEDDDDDDDDDDDGEEDDDAREEGEKSGSVRTKGRAKGGARKIAGGGEGWSRHRKSADVKIRGLARSFDRDGVMVFRGERPGFSLELQARLVDAFGREGESKGSSARAFAQPLCDGRRGYPLLMSAAASREAAGLPATADFDAWLMQRLERVQDVAVDDPGVVESADDPADYERLLERLKAGNE